MPGRVNSRKKRKKQNNHLRRPIGTQSITRRQLRIRADDLPFIRPNHPNTLYERREFAPRRRGTRYRGTNQSLNDFSARRSRKNGTNIYANSRNVPPTRSLQRQLSLEQYAHPIGSTRATPIHIPVNNGSLYHDWTMYKSSHGI